MSNAALSTMTAQLMAAMARAGLADAASFCATPRAAPLACTVMVDRDVRLVGFESQVTSAHVLITALAAEVGLPAAGSAFVIGDQRFVVDAITAADEARVVCVVTPEAAS